MLLSEVAKEVNLTKRAIKYYEEQELLHVPKDANGYRNYSEEHLNILKEISVYRKLGIGIADIKKILETRDFSLLEQIYEEKNQVYSMFACHTLLCYHSSFGGNEHRRDCGTKVPSLLSGRSKCQ